MASQLWGYSPPSFKQSWFGGNGLCVLPGSLSNTKKPCITLHQPPWSCHSWKQRCLSPVHQIHRDDFPGALGVWFQMFQISTRWVLQLQKFGTCDWPSRCFLQSENRYRLPFLSCHENSINFTCQMGGQGCQEWKTCQHQWLQSSTCINWHRELSWRMQGWTTRWIWHPAPNHTWQAVCDSQKLKAQPSKS